MISCVLIDGLLHEGKSMYQFRHFCLFFGKHLQKFSMFDKVYFATHTEIPTEYQVGGIEYIRLPLLSFDEYQLLSVGQLYSMFPEDFVVTCQLDGFPVYPSNWKSEFLEYDYIGAPWSPDTVKHHLKTYYDEDFNVDLLPSKYMVGNSGFCLRSRKFLEVSAKSTFPLHLCPVHHNHFMTTPKFDDWFFCIGARSFFEINGIEFAPVDVASKFSLEAVSRELGNEDLTAPVYTKKKNGYQMESLPIQQCIDKAYSFGYHGRSALNHILGVKE